MRKSVVALLTSCLLAACGPTIRHERVEVEAPFAMEAISVPIYPARDFPITDYGASHEELCTEAIARAVEACNAAGGGRVVIPAGEWLTGPIHLKSNVNLHLAEGAVVRFTDNPADYLPAVHTSWEGMECYNYSPLVYAFECENVAITGAGKLYPKMELWREWFPRPKAHMDALARLYHQMSQGVPVEERQMAEGENHFRPHLIQLNRCRNVLLDGFEIEGSPFWTIHLYLCNGGVVRNLKVWAHGHNSDGVDLEMSRNFLVENCIFDQGDDAVVIKSGRNHDAWRLNSPAENIVVRNCTIRAGHTLLGIGSELAGGIRNIYMTNCDAPGTVHRLFFVKTNHRRGAFVEHIYMDSIHTGGTLRVAEIDTDVLYQWRDLVPTYKDTLTRISHIHLRNIRVDSAKGIYEFRGDERLPIRHITMQNVEVGCVADTTNRVQNVEGLTLERVGYRTVDAEALPQLNRYLSNK
ncbi:MAG: glycoside hydrolase family 28 protein [Alistipes sp.]|nr:glycoside hydrolase family 28 protein [Alistipes sp.]